MGARKFLSHFICPLCLVGLDISEGMANVPGMAKSASRIQLAELEGLLSRLLRVIPLRVLRELCVHPALQLVCEVSFGCAGMNCRNDGESNSWK